MHDRKKQPPPPNFRSGDSRTWLKEDAKFAAAFALERDTLIAGASARVERALARAPDGWPEVLRMLAAVIRIAIPDYLNACARGRWSLDRHEVVLRLEAEVVVHVMKLRETSRDLLTQATTAAAVVPNTISGLCPPGRWRSVVADLERTAIELERRKISAPGQPLDLEDGVEAAAPIIKLPELGPHDRKAWQASLVHGMTQQKIADELNREHGTSYKQWHVCRMIRRAKAHAEASGLAEKVQRKAERERAMDPERLDVGKRTDRKGHDIRARARQRARDLGE